MCLFNTENREQQLKCDRNMINEVKTEHTNAGGFGFLVCPWCSTQDTHCGANHFINISSCFRPVREKEVVL